jgi:hypothetical protein
LAAIGGTLAGDLWAVGGTYTESTRHMGNVTVTSYTPTAWIEHWDGAAWSPSPAPSPGRYSFLADVVVTSDGTGFAVGGFDRPRTSSQTLVLQACGV